jgi:hypothetical protein
MIICVHVERTAGSSIHASFYQHFKNRWFIPSHPAELDNITECVSKPRRKNVYLGGHFGFKDLEERGLTPRAKILFAVVRDPVARLASLYNLMRRNPDWLPSLHEVVQDGTFELFFDACLQLDAHVGNIQCARIGGEPTFEAARATIIEHYSLLGCTERMDRFVPALENEVRKLAPAFSYIRGVASNSANKMHGEISQELADRIRADSSEDVKLVNWIHNDLGGLWARDTPAKPI